MRLSEIAQPKKLLVLVHPGSACGSADFNLGRYDAGPARDFLASDVADWDGPIVVIDGNLSDELPRYPRLDVAIKQALTRAKQNNEISVRVFGDDDQPPHQNEVAAKMIKKLRLDPSQYRIELTGAWFHPAGDTGCVNSVQDVFDRAGFRTAVRDSALRLDDEEDENYKEERQR